MGNWTLDGDLAVMNLDIIAPSGRIAMIDCENEELTDEEIMANANLIAAAPDLLAALVNCLDLIEGEGLDELHGDLAEVVRDAITKARGAD